ncbi:hypothetical protein AAFF_G00158070 [Aldrovandia affinis]|uniref:Uncharacterized protein n=1 Tax=Aldrovandia affinis TaxID=143900 RepID=A0AAD7W7Q0_9TELE|nr:hypothetical protein AAFF_G00158070 [Aldrovandia affinis]
MVIENETRGHSLRRAESTESLALLASVGNIKGRTSRRGCEMKARPAARQPGAGRPEEFSGSARAAGTARNFSRVSPLALRGLAGIRSGQGGPRPRTLKWRRVSQRRPRERNNTFRSERGPPLMSGPVCSP